MPDNSPRTREQVRAAVAHDFIRGMKSGEKEVARQFLRLPALIHQCGLCQALAFMEAKKFEHVLAGLALVVSAPEEEPEKRLDGAGLAKRARDAGMIEYQWLSREALRSAQWLKRYSEAILDLKPGDDDGGKR
jgi:CRISPR-associated protein Cmr5